MAVTTPPTVDALPAAPSTTAPSTFAALADAFIAALATFRTQLNALASNVFGNATDAATSAATASAAATAAAAATSAVEWVSGTTYAEGDGVWSPSDHQTYRRIVAGAGTTDPSLDPTNWLLLSLGGTIAQINARVSDADLAILGANAFTGDQTIGNNNLKTIKTATFNGQVTVPAVGGSATQGNLAIDWSAGQNYLQTEPTGAINYATGGFTAPPGVCHLQLIIASDGTSTAQTITWPASVKWIGSTWGGVNNKAAVINFWYDGTSYWATGTNIV